MELLKAPTPSTLEVLVPHRHAPLTCEGKRRPCLRVDAGRRRAHVAAEAGISRQCLHEWHTRWLAEGFNRTLAQERAYAGVFDSSAERVAALPA